MNKNKLRKGFTIIELIVVIAILGILVLLAAPKFLGYTEKAKVTQIKNDIVAYEKAIDTKRIDDDKYINDWEEIDVPTMESLKNSLFNKKGLINGENEVSFAGEYYKIPKDNELVKTNLKGDFYLGEGGEVYYYDENLENKGDNETPTEKPEHPTDEDLGYSEDDFTWIKEPDGYIGSKPDVYIGLNGEKGYFQYTGTGRSVVEIPHVIQGVPMTSYYKMFDEAPAEVTKVISTNKNVTNMSYMFYWAKAENLDLSNFDTSNVTNMRSMFSSSKARNLDVSELDTSNVTNMSNMFYWAKAENLDLSNFDTSNVTDMSYMFTGLVAGTLDLSSFNTSNVTNMSNMFAALVAGTLDLSSFNTSNVTDMSSMFNYSKTTSITFGPNFNTSNVTIMSYMFYESRAESLDLSTFDTSNVTNMRGMFQNSKAGSLDLSSFNTSNVTDMSEMFSGSQATSLDLSSFNTSNVTDMFRMFENSKATTGYARTQTDANKFNASSRKPVGLKFVVKTP